MKRATETTGARRDHDFHAVMGRVIDEAEPQRLAVESAYGKVETARHAHAATLRRIDGLENRKDSLRAEISARVAGGMDAQALIRECASIEAELAVERQLAEDLPSRIEGLERAAVKADADFQAAVRRAADRMLCALQAEIDQAFFELVDLFQDFRQARDAAGLPGHVNLLWRDERAADREKRAFVP